MRQLRTLDVWIQSACQAATSQRRCRSCLQAHLIPGLLQPWRYQIRIMVAQLVPCHGPAKMPLKARSAMIPRWDQASVVTPTTISLPANVVWSARSLPHDLLESFSRRSEIQVRQTALSIPAPTTQCQGHNLSVVRPHVRRLVLGRLPGLWRSVRTRRSGAATSHRHGPSACRSRVLPRLHRHEPPCLGMS